MAYSNDISTTGIFPLNDGEIDDVNGGLLPAVLVVSAGVVAVSAVFKAGEELGETLHDVIHGDHA